MEPGDVTEFRPDGGPSTAEARQALSETCPICFHDFELTRLRQEQPCCRQPICSVCLDEMSRRGRSALRCPFCRQLPHKAAMHLETLPDLLELLPHLFETLFALPERAHDREPQSGAASSPGSSPWNYKTRLCHFFQRGSCLYGAECNFAHGREELQRLQAERMELMQQAVASSQALTRSQMYLATAAAQAAELASQMELTQQAEMQRGLARAAAPAGSSSRFAQLMERVNLARERSTKVMEQVLNLLSAMDCDGVQVVGLLLEQYRQNLEQWQQQMLQFGLSGGQVSLAHQDP